MSAMPLDDCLCPEYILYLNYFLNVLSLLSLTGVNNANCYLFNSSLFTELKLGVWLF